MNLLHADYAQIQKNIEDVIGLKCKNFKLEVESLEYRAATFQINDIRIIFRVAKTTPTKIGQFVTFWKRINNSPIMPFDTLDPFNFLMVYVYGKNNFGLFIFPKSVLVSKGVISQNGKGGKRAIRVYPPWDITHSKQAQTTQMWQLRYFIELQSDGSSHTITLQKMLLASLQ